MNELNTIFAVKLMNKLKGQPESDNLEIKDLVSELSADKNSLHVCISRTHFDADKPVNEMSIEEYRAYTEFKINRFSMSEQQKKVHFTIHITETGLNAMRQDKGYESYVFGAVQAAFNQPFYSPFSENCLLYFDTLENSSCMSWSSMDKITSYNIEEAGMQEYREEEQRLEKGQENQDAYDAASSAGSGRKPAASLAGREKSDKMPDRQYNYSRLKYPYLMPMSRYERILYAYNIMPEDWVPHKK